MSENRREAPRTLFERQEMPTPAHDRIIRWLDAQVRAIMANIASEPWPEQERAALLAEVLRDHEEAIRSAEATFARLIDPTTYYAQTYPEVIAERKKNHPIEIAASIKKHVALMTKLRAQPLPPRVSELEIVWEKPVMRKDFVVGFVDLWWQCRREKELYLDRFGNTGEKRISSYSEKRGCSYEVKPRVDSVGAVIRQVRFYESLAPGKYVIVAPAGDYQKDFENQGIGFMAVPPEVLSEGK